jgi:hypothetical protein
LQRVKDVGLGNWALCVLFGAPFNIILPLTSRCLSVRVSDINISGFLSSEPCVLRV